MRPKLLDIDLDFFNRSTNPSRSFQTILSKLPRGIPVALVVEHHEILPYVRKWVSSGALATPFHWFHMDDHHDFYNRDLDIRSCNNMARCDNFGFHMPTEWYQTFHWVRNAKPGGGSYEEWYDALRWLRQHGKAAYYRNRLPKWHGIGAIAITVSPDYLEGWLRRDHLKQMLADINRTLKPKMMVRPFGRSERPQNWTRVGVRSFRKWSKLA